MHSFFSDILFYFFSYHFTYFCCCCLLRGETTREAESIFVSLYLNKGGIITSLSVLYNIKIYIPTLNERVSVCYFFFTFMNVYEYRKTFCFFTSYSECVVIVRYI